jgi:hypothetical protein
MNGFHVAQLHVGRSAAPRWVPAGEMPTPAEARQRLELLAARGPTPDAFMFKTRFDPPKARAVVSAARVPPSGP